VPPDPATDGVPGACPVGTLATLPTPLALSLSFRSRSLPRSPPRSPRRSPALSHSHSPLSFTLLLRPTLTLTPPSVSDSLSCCVPHSLSLPSSVSVSCSVSRPLSLSDAASSAASPPPQPQARAHTPCTAPCHYPSPSPFSCTAAAAVAAAAAAAAAEARVWMRTQEGRNVTGPASGRAGRHRSPSELPASELASA